jgi:hypothetical protein
MNEYAKIFRHAALIWCLFSLSTNATEIAIPQCPKKLTVQQTIESSAIDGWKKVNDDSGAISLYNVFLSTSAEQSNFLVPTEKKESSKTRRLTDTKILAYYDDLPFDASGVRNYWMICDYARAAVTVVRKLPKNVVRCEIRHSLLTSSEEVSLRCFDKPRKKPRY